MKSILRYAIAQKARAFQQETLLEEVRRNKDEMMGDYPDSFDFAFDLMKFIESKFELTLKPENEEVEPKEKEADKFKLALRNLVNEVNKEYPGNTIELIGKNKAFKEAFELLNGTEL